MSDTVQARYLASTPQDFWGCICTAITIWSGFGGTDFYGFEALDDTYGPAVRMWKAFEDGGNTYSWYVDWNDAVWPSPMPSRPWASTPCTSGELQGQQGFGITDEGVCVDVWAALAVAIQDWLYLALDVDSVDLLDTRVVVSDIGQLQLGTLNFVLDAETAYPTYLVWCYNLLTVYPVTLDRLEYAGYARRSPSISATENGTMVGGSVDRIADALEVISLQDQELSVNHNAYMWSIRGKVRVG